MSKWIWKKYNANGRYTSRIYKGKYLPGFSFGWEEDDSNERDPDHLIVEAEIYKASVQSDGLVKKGPMLSDYEKRNGNLRDSDYYTAIYNGVEYLGTNVNTYHKIYFQEVYEIESRRVLEGYKIGSYIGEITADYNAYTNNARNKDGYWYVRDREANQAPRLIGDFKDLGTRNGAFTLEFQVDDQDTDQALKAAVRLNGSQIKVFENMTRRQSYEINITNELLKDLEFNKRNTVNISLTDGNVTVEENFYFTKTNRPPEITVANSNMGTQNKEFKITFSATDPDGDAMTAKIYIDGVQVEDLGAITAGQEKAYSIKREDFITLKNGEHKIRIDVTDAEGSQSSSFITFTKMVTWYLYEYTEELGNKAVDIRIDMLANLAEGITKKIEVCNNALDTKPTWETIEEGKWVKFKNTTKTSAKWGLGVRVRVDRGTATQDSYIYGFNISYA